MQGPLIARAALVALALLAPPAGAQPAPGAGRYETTVLARPIRDDAAASIVVSRTELARRGARTLAEALDLIPETHVKQGGNGVRLIVRGAKPPSLLLLIDGTPVDEPYFGGYDLTAIPITDIAEIRVQLAPASPLEGPGGDGGTIEVLTVHATGRRRVDARIAAGTAPSGEGSLTVHLPLGAAWGLRASAGAGYAAPGYPVLRMDGRGATFVDRTLAAYGGLRIERQSARGRFTADLFYGHRAFAIPPSDTQGATIQNVTGEDAARAVVGGEARLGPLRIAAGGYGELLSRATDYFRDYTLQSPTSHQDLLSGRAGAAVHLDRWLSRRGVRARISARLAADGEAARIVQAKAAPVTGWSIYSGLAVGGLVHWKWLRLEGAAGMLVALDHPSTWWPEGKLSLAVQPFRWLTFSLIGARKGRLPTLRELYDPLVGNPQLAPEQTWHGELRAEVRPHPLVAARWSAYLRRIDGAIRLDPNAAALAGRNVNVDTIDVRGMEVGVDVARGRLVGAGLSYLFEDASSPTLGLDPITDFPRHRLDVYLASTWRGRLGGLLRFRWVSERVVQAVTLPGYQVLDASGWAQLDERLRLVVRVDDVLDQRYVELPGLLSPPTTVTASLEGIWN